MQIFTITLTRTVFIWEIIAQTVKFSLSFYFHLVLIIISRHLSVCNNDALQFKTNDDEELRLVMLSCIGYCEEVRAFPMQTSDI